MRITSSVEHLTQHTTKVIYNTAYQRMSTSSARPGVLRLTPYTQLLEAKPVLNVVKSAAKHRENTTRTSEKHGESHIDWSEAQGIAFKA